MINPDGTPTVPAIYAPSHFGPEVTAWGEYYVGALLIVVLIALLVIGRTPKNGG